jgi:hypothetical protein
MEKYFQPANRLFVWCRDEDGLNDFERNLGAVGAYYFDADYFHENPVEIETTESAEDILLHRGFQWTDFVSVARGKIVWINQNAFFNFHESRLNLMDHLNHFQAFLNVHAGTKVIVSVYATSVEHATVACDMMLRLLAISEGTKIKLDPGFAWGEIESGHHQFPVTGPALSYLLVHSRNLLHLELTRFHLNTDHCRAIDALDTSTNVGLELELSQCLTIELGEKILLESIGKNRGPTKLKGCQIGIRRLADAIRGNNRLNYLSLHETSHNKEESLHFFEALAENEGITILILNSLPITHAIWTTLWQSISHHPKLERVSILMTANTYCSDAHKTLWTQAIVDALRINTVLFDIDLYCDSFDKVRLDNDVHLRLLANKYRPRIAAIAKQNGEWRRKLLRRALASVASNPSLIWMFLSGNTNSLFPPMTLKRKGVPSSDTN